MTIDTSEKRFEDSIETTLLDGGYIKRKSENFNKEHALDPELFFEFLQKSQKEKWLQIEEMYGSEVKDEILRVLEKELLTESMIQVIRSGFTVSGVHLDCAFFKPVSSLNPESQKQYDSNILSVIRQARYSEVNPKSLDLLLCLNGLPVVTAELKNPSKGQNYEDAIRQYKEDRDPKELLFQFKKRTLVHFAVDTRQVFMTTKLDGDKTVFLPFNKGRSGAAGNPNNPDGYDTAYLWETIWQKDSWLEILSDFVNLQIIEQKPPAPPKEFLIFPRYHQLDTVNKLANATKRDILGTNYLIQHSTGSGKSNTIAWLAYKLFSSFRDDKPIFDGIIVISDRIAIVDQLANTIMQFEQTPGTVDAIESSAELAENLETHRKILISTQQKFPFVLEKMQHLKGRNFAIIIDEAHSSQTGESAEKVKEVLTQNLDEHAQQEAKEEEAKKDLVDRIEEEIQKRGPQENLNYYAFTATPKKKTLRLFGIKVSDEDYIPFHIYSMRQAIEENFILDILKNYTTYERYFKIEKTTPEEKIVEGKKASKVIQNYVNTHSLNLGAKAKIIVDHFRTHTQPKIGGLAKAMVVSSSRLQALKYKQEIDEYIKDKEYSGINTIVAFSGSLKINGDIKTEQNINKTKTDQELRDKFATSDYNILVVAEKYQTGYDQPLLHTMYVDKKLHGIKAVQTLSRLNRTHPGKVDTFVVDFHNTIEEIQNAFKAYYTGTILSDKTDSAYLLNLYDKILEFGIITQRDLDNYAIIFFKSRKEQINADQGKLDGTINPVILRYKETDEQQQDDFRLKLKKFIEAYSFLSQVANFEPKLEKLFVVSKALAGDPDLKGFGAEIPELRGDISLKWYRLEKTHEGDISIGPEGRPLVLGDDYGTPSLPDVMTPLSQIVQVFNERFGGKFKDADIITTEEWERILQNMPDLREMAQVNEFADFLRHFEARLEEVMLDSMNQNQSLVIRIFTTPELRREITVKAAESFQKWAKSEILVIRSDTPIQNKTNFRSTIHKCEGLVKWVDLFVGQKGLEFFLDSYNSDKVKDIKILSSLYNNEYQISENLKDEFIKYQKELEQKGTTIQMKLVSTKSAYDKVSHDRFLIGENIKFNVPSYTTMVKGRLSEISETTTDVPFDDYWNDTESLDIIKDWEKIKEILSRTKHVFEYICADCGKKFELSFKLPEGRSAYCQKCFLKHRR